MIDKRMLVDEVTIRFRTGLNEFGKPSYSEPMALSLVRFDRGVTGSFEGKNSTKRQVGVLYIYPRYCPVEVDDTWLHALVNDGARDYEVTAFQVNLNPFNRAIFSYEVEVI